MPDREFKVLLSRPKDRSVEAFRAWIMEIAWHLNPNAQDDQTPEQWKQAAEAFWGKADSDKKDDS